jgi:hypothetical protein
MLSRLTWRLMTEPILDFGLEEHHYNLLLTIKEQKRQRSRFANVNRVSKIPKPLATSRGVNSISKIQNPKSIKLLASGVLAGLVRFASRRYQNHG